MMSKVVAILACAFVSGCYTLNGISISPETSTYFIEQFEVTTIEAPAETGQQFTELLKQKVNDNTRLTFDESNPNVSFVGSIAGFSVTPEAPNSDNRADLNRLSIRISVEYTDNLTEANSYRQTFSDFALFDATADFTAVQDGLLADLFDRMSEEAFNKAFSNW